MFGSTVASALKSSAAFSTHDTGYSGTAGDGLTDLRANRRLTGQYDTASTPGNIVQTGQVPVGSDTTFTLALGFGADRTAAASAASASLSAGFAAAESSYGSGWHGYLSGKTVPASVSGDTVRRRTYLVGLMTLHGLEDKTYPGANVASLATPWGDQVDGGTLNDGYHRVWARDLYRAPRCSRPATPRRPSAWRSGSGAASRSPPGPRATASRTGPGPSPATRRSAG